MRQRFVPIVAAMALLPALAGCVLQRAINSQFPPANTGARALAATEQSLKTLATVDKVDAYAALGAEDIRSQLRTVLLAKDPRLKSLSLEPERQELVAAVRFDGAFPEAHVTLAGTATLHVAVAVEGPNLVLQPSASTIHISRAKLASGFSVAAVLPLSNVALRTFLDNINGTIKAIRYPLDYSVVKSMKPADFFRNVPGVTSATGSEVTFQVFVEKTAVLIDDSGIHALARLAVPSRGWESDTASTDVDCSKDPGPEPLIACRSDCPFLDMACHAEKLDCEVRKAQRLAEYRFLRLEFDKQCSLKAAAAAPATAPATAPANLGVLHEELARRFRERSTADLGGPGDTLWSHSGAMVSKSFLSGSLNRALGSATLCVTYTAPAVEEPFNQKIKTDPAPNLKCTENVRSCTPTQDCTPTRDCTPAGDCNPNWGCPDCDWYDVGCHARKAGCELDKQRYRTQCELEKSLRKADCERLKATEKALCEADKEAKRLDCERLKAMEIAGCQINQDWLDLWGDKEIGGVTGKVRVAGAEVRACIQGLSVAADLSRAEIAATVSANAPVRADLKFTPYNLIGNIACLGQWSATISASGLVAPQALKLGAGIVPSRNETGDFQLGLRTDSAVIKGRIQPPPLAALLSQNPQLIVQCAPAVAGGLIYGRLHPEDDPFSKADIDIPLPSQALPLVLEPFTVKSEGATLILEPEVTSKAVQFFGRTAR